MSRVRKVVRKPAKAARTSRAAKPGEVVVVAEESSASNAATAAVVSEVAAEVAAPAGQGQARAGLKLEASCTLRDSIDMQFQLLAVDFGDSDVVVDGSVVERIDTAGLQMLLSFVKHQASRGKRVQWSGASPELVRGAQLLGIYGMLALPGSNGGSEARGN
jgi:phospholipid transport system transporter-binding protein